MRTQPKLSVSIELFKDAGCDENDQQKILYGSGITTSIEYCAAHICGYKNIRLYDESWQNGIPPTPYQLRLKKPADIWT